MEIGKEPVSKTVKIIIPMYKQELTSMERISLLQCKKILGKYPVCIIKPKGLQLTDNEVQGIEVLELEPKWFKSVQSYNDLMLCESFYEYFLDYKFILLYQLDAFVFHDGLLEFCQMDYDYIGAPWLYGQFAYVNDDGEYIYVGNGGLSLRKVKSHLKVLKNREKEDNANEDIFFSSSDPKEFKVAPVEIALKFAFETHVRECYEKNGGKLPFGCHAWNKYDFSFLKPHVEDQGYDTEGIKDEALDMQENFFSCDLAKVTEKKLKQALFSISGKYPEEVWIWGSGRIGKRCGWLLKKNNINIKGFLDKNPQTHGKKIYGISILPIKEYLDNKVDIPVIIAMLDVPERILMELEESNKTEAKDYILWKNLNSILTKEMKRIQNV